MTAINKLTAENVATFANLTTGNNDLDIYQALATLSAIYPGRGTPLGLTYVALKMNGETGEFAEHVGKAMRDDDLSHPFIDRNGEPTDAFGFSELTPERKALLIKEIGDVLWYLSAACNELGISLSEAALTNLQKLAARTEAGTLQGSGDDR